MAPTVAHDSLTITDNRTGKTINVPIVNNTISAVALKKLSAPYAPNERVENDTPSGVRVYDPGFLNTAVLESTITYIDGEKGILRYRGYPIEQLAESSNFLESAYLLIYGSLPTTEQFRNFSDEVMGHTTVHRDIESIVSSFRFDAHPMSILTSSFAALGAFAPEANPSLQGQTIYTNASKGDPAALKLMDKQIYRALGKSMTLAAMSYKIRQGRNFNLPPVGADYTTTFLYLLDRLNERDYKPNPILAKALDTLFLLHADHELNCSTAAMLQSGSSLTDPYSALAAATSALYGPLHGGACEAVIRMLLEIGTPENVPEFIEKVKRKEAVLSGFGHRIYRTTDPRSKIIEKTAKEVFALTGSSPLLATALKLRDLALLDDYFISRKLFANVDFFSGLIYKQIGFPLDFFPVLFAVPRTVGWLAHWRQLMLSPKVTIWRPRQVYVGEGKRDYTPIAKRVSTSDDPRTQPSKVDHVFSTRARL